jgi:hypothetical protein
MSFAPPPRRVPASVAWDTTTILVAMFVAGWGLWIAVAARDPVRPIGVVVIAIAIAAIPVAVWRNRHLLDLMRNGEITDASIVSCRLPGTRQLLPIDDVQGQWRRIAAEQALRTSIGMGQRILGCVPWIGFGLFMLMLTPLIAGLFSGPARPVPIVLVLLGGTAVALMIYAALRMHTYLLNRFYIEPAMKQIEAKLDTTTGDRPFRLECEFEFVAGGTIVRGRDLAEFTAAPHDKRTEPVLYLPSDPRLARLVRALPLAMQVHLDAA